MNSQTSAQRKRRYFLLNNRAVKGWKTLRKSHTNSFSSNSLHNIWKQLNARDLAASIGADHVSRSADRSLLETPWLGNSSPTLVTRSQSESESFSLMLLLNKEAHEDLSAALRFAPDVYASGDIWVERCTWCERACMRLIFEPTIR